MGLLSLGTPLKWEEVKKHCEHVREHGIEQLIHIFHNNQNVKNKGLLWGDEVEYMVVDFDEKAHEARLSLRQSEILKLLESVDDNLNVSFHPEYGRYMLEATPARPFSGEFTDLLKVEPNMEQRRKIAQSHMTKTSEWPLTITSYPMLGSPNETFTDPPHSPNGPAAQSLFLPDELINKHARFPTLTANIRSRRGKKVSINVPIFKDANTPVPFEDFSKIAQPEGAALPDHIYMDAMGFGMGCCCLQLTFQATDIDEARNLYDQLTPLAPIMLALTGASPAYRGYLSDQDARWNVIAGSVDDRNDVELGKVEPDDKSWGVPWNSHSQIPKSRYDSIDSYISNTNETLRQNPEEYNDQKLVINNKVKKRLLDAGFDELLANHFAHLFIRDPLVIFKELLDQDDSKDSDHFENIQSTNWQTMRFKPPPVGDANSTGWRVEFRPMEVQVTDFENAAFSVFIVLVTRVILSYKLNLYMPISKVDENMKVAHFRDAVNQNMFWFRTNILSSDTGHGEYKELSVNQIINGGPEFVGLIPLVRRYLQVMNVDLSVLCHLETYLGLVSKRASGQLCTAATYIRKFIASHPDYKHDSRISQQVNYDLMSELRKLTQHKDTWDTGLAKEFLGGLN